MYYYEDDITKFPAFNFVARMTTGKQITWKDQLRLFRQL